MTTAPEPTGKVLVLLNDAPYGSERSYNGLRLALSLARGSADVKVFLFGDATGCAKKNQRVPTGYYSLERMLTGLFNKGVEVGLCGSCMDARGMGEDELVEGAHRSSMEECTRWTLWADRIVTF